MPALRFFTPLLPLLSTLAAFIIQDLIKIFIIKKITLSLLFTTTAICTFNLFQWKNNINFNKNLIEDKVAEYGKEVGLYLKDNFEEDTIIATNTAGTIPFYSEFKTIDMLGLNDKHIARRDMPNMGKGFAGHEKTDGKYIISLEPDIIQFGSSLGSKDPILISDIEISKLDEFTQNYKLNEYKLPSGRTLYLYLRNR